MAATKEHKLVKKCLPSQFINFNKFCVLVYQWLKQDLFQPLIYYTFFSVEIQLKKPHSSSDWFDILILCESV